MIIFTILLLLLIAVAVLAVALVTAHLKHESLKVAITNELYETKAGLATWIAEVESDLKAHKKVAVVVAPSPTPETPNTVKTV